MRTVMAVALSGVLGAGAAWADDLRLGMIGLDTSHVVAFTKILNDAKHPDYIPGAKVVAAFKGGTPDNPTSADRVDGFTEQLERDWDVTIVPTIEALCTQVDAVLLESVDGRPHLEQARPVIEAGLPLFIDKPVAGSLADAIAIYRLAETHGVPCWSASSYRFYPPMTALKNTDVGELRGAISWGPCHLEAHHPDLFWYGVHPTEALYTIMGTGCQTVVRTHTACTDVVTGVWDGGRVGTLRGLRDQKTPHKVVVFGTKAVAEQEPGGNYAPLVVEVVKAFQTGVVPVPPEETIEMFAFMEAADESKRQGGVPVSIADVMAKAEAELAAR